MSGTPGSDDVDIEKLEREVQRTRDLIKESEQKAAALETQIEALREQLNQQQSKKQEE
jgi:hypothetical protein